MESARVCFVDDWYLTLFSWLLSLHVSPTQAPPPFLWCADMRPLLSLLKDAKSSDSDSLWRPHVNAFASWKTSPNAVMFQILGLRTLPGIWGNTTVHRRHTRVPYTWDTAPDLSSLPSCHFLQPAYVSWAQGPPFMTIISHLIIMSFSGFSGQGGGITAEPQKWMFDFSAPVL